MRRQLPVQLPAQLPMQVGRKNSTHPKVQFVQCTLVLVPLVSLPMSMLKLSRQPRRQAISIEI